MEIEMMMELDSDRRSFPAADLGALLERHGAVRVLAALAMALVRRARRPRAVAAHDLSPRLRRDTGLTWDPPSPRHWDLRL